MAPALFSLLVLTPPFTQTEACIGRHNAGASFVRVSTDPGHFKLGSAASGAPRQPRPIIAA